MKKEVLSEIYQIKYLFDYKPGMVISEQRNSFIEIESGEQEEQILSTKGKDFQKLITYAPHINSVFNRVGMNYKRNNKTKTAEIGYYDDESKFIKGLSPEAINVSEKMEKYMDETSRGVFNEMKQKNPLFFVYVLSRYNDSEIRKRRNIIVDSATTVKQKPPVEEKPKETIEPGVKITTDDAIVQPNFFNYNEATLTPQFKSFVNENIISYVNQLKQNLESYGGSNEGILDSLIIKASSSKLRNGPSRTVQNDGKNCSTNPATNKPFEACPTHLTLSKARAEAAKNYIINELQKNNIKIDENKIVLDYQGENGDGTSGPEFVQGDNPKDEKFSKAQRVDINAVIAIRTNPETKVKKTDENLQSTEPVEETDYRVIITGKTRGSFKINLPSFDFSRFFIPKFGSSGASKAQLEQVKCSN